MRTLPEGSSTPSASARSSRRSCRTYSPQLFFVAQLRAQITEEGIHPLKLNLIDADGASVVALSGQANVGLPQRGTEATARILLRLGNVSFKTEGDYSFRLVLDNQEAVRIPLRVSLRPQSEPAPPA